MIRVEINFLYNCRRKNRTYDSKSIFYTIVEEKIERASRRVRSSGKYGNRIPRTTHSNNTVVGNNIKTQHYGEYFLVVLAFIYNSKIVKYTVKWGDFGHLSRFF